MFVVSEQKNSVITAVEFAVLPSRIFGLFAVKFRRKRFVTSKYFQFFGVAICFLFWINFIIAIPESRRITPQNYVTEIVNYVDSFLLSCIQSVAVIESIRSFGKVKTAIKTCLEAERLLTEMSQQPTFRCSMKYTLMQTPLFVICLFSGIRNYAMGAPMYAIFMLVIVSVIELSLLAALVHQYSGLLGILTALKGHCSKALTANSIGPFQAPKAISLTRLYDNLCDAADLVHDSQVLQILMIVVFSFIIFVTQGYNIYTAILLPDGWNKYEVLLLESSWFISGLLLTLQIAGACADCTQKAKEFNMLLYQLMIDDKTEEISNNKKLRLHILMKREVVFTACGFFTLDYTLVHSMIAAATTYLVILIQFGQNSPTPNILPTSLPNGTATTR